MAHQGFKKRTVCSGIIIKSTEDGADTFTFAYIPDKVMLPDDRFVDMVRKYMEKYEDKKDIGIIGDLIIDRLCRESKPKAAMLIIKRGHGDIISLVREECFTDPDVKMEILSLIQTFGYES